MLNATKQYIDSDLFSEHAQQLWYEIISKAEEIFTEIGVASDFCIQDGRPPVVVFGSVNRLLWSPDGGFRPDPSYCTQKFLTGFANIK